ncbi:KAP family P-loop NTPase fold protein [Allohahella marinimesophila]|uniref:KAP NTPase domain-containing protein n=1 Tax=Allohahella marinimesophila TaxID=1054972 RepID=A0ABP7NUV6_9GAMM
MNINSYSVSLGLDQPLEPETAADNDLLMRDGFVKRVTSLIDQLSPTRGFVVSIEGKWGSGKSSVLNMIKAELGARPTSSRPVCINFEPWLIGDRHALLQLFLTSLGTAIQLRDSNTKAKSIAAALDAYSELFDIVALIPGAAPLAALAKVLTKKGGEATGKIATMKESTLESRKQAVQEALKAYDRSVVVFIDDIDRLSAPEVYEMIRIIKAVGDFQNVGYIVAWDPDYVIRALKSLEIPMAATYLDKIVQVRQTLPKISAAAHAQLMSAATDRLNPEAQPAQFSEAETRLQQMYHDGLRELLETPRDIARLFNAVELIEPSLRGELALSDIIGLEALKQKAPAVFSLIQGNPEWFVGQLSRYSSPLDKAEDQSSRDALYKVLTASPQPKATISLVQFLFPYVSERDQHGIYDIRDAEGHIGSVRGLTIALQASVDAETISLMSIKKYISQPAERDSVIALLTAQNCPDFLKLLGDSQFLLSEDFDCLEGLALSVAQAVDQHPFNHPDVPTFGNLALTASKTIDQLLRNLTSSQTFKISLMIIRDPLSLSVAVMRFSGLGKWLEKTTVKDIYDFPLPDAVELERELVQNITRASEKNRLLSLCEPGLVLFNLPSYSSDACKLVFQYEQRNDPTLDVFISTLLQGPTTASGRTYVWPKDTAILEAYCSIPDLKSLAHSRLKETNLKHPFKAAWQVVAFGKGFYENGEPFEPVLGS